MIGFTLPQFFFFKCDMLYVYATSAKGKVREMTMTAIGHVKEKVNCLSRQCL